MCYPEKCPRCGKTGWAGCGQHVDDVMRPVPRRKDAPAKAIPRFSRNPASPISRFAAPDFRSTRKSVREEQNVVTESPSSSGYTR